MGWRMSLNAFVVIILSFVAAGCATIVTGTSQSVTVDVLNAPGAKCKGIDKKGRVYFWYNTPAFATVHKGDGPITLTCEKSGFKKTVHSFDETLVGATLANIILGGGIGILIDAVSGAAQQYASYIQLVMEPLSSAALEEKLKYRKMKKDLAAKLAEKKKKEQEISDRERPKEEDVGP